MAVTPELLAAGFAGLLLILGAIGTYLRSLRAPPRQPDAILTGIGLELGNKEQMERLIAELKRIADVAEKRAADAAELKRIADALTDKNSADIQERFDDVDDALKRLRDTEKHEIPRRR